MAKRSAAQRVDRREAGKAVAAAKRAGTEATKLAKTLSRDARTSLEAVTASSHADIREARTELDDRPRRAKRLARRAAAHLAKASLRATGSGDAERRALAESDAKKRAATIKRRRKQAKQMQKMAKFVAIRTIAASVMTPTDEEQAKKDLKLARRHAKA